MQFKVSGLQDRNLDEPFTFFDNLTDAYLSLDTYFKIITANKAFLNITGQILPTIVGINIKTLYPTYSIEGINVGEYIFNTTSLKVKNTEYFIVKFQIAAKPTSGIKI